MATIREHLPIEVEKMSIDSILWSLVVKNGYGEVARCLESIGTELTSNRVDHFVTNYGKVK